VCFGTNDCNKLNESVRKRSCVSYARSCVSCRHSIDYQTVTHDRVNLMHGRAPSHYMFHTKPESSRTVVCKEHTVVCIPISIAQIVSPFRYIRLYQILRMS